ncbi:MAG: peptidylprolyl isomerase [Candidatus Xenobia bacterium]
MKRQSKSLAILGILVAVVALWGWAMSGPGRPHLNTDVTPAPLSTEVEAATPSPKPSASSANALMKPDKEEVVLVTKRGKIVFELFPNAAPHHVAQIKRLVKAHYYDGLLFHRVIPGFMIQFGDPNTRKPDRSKWGQGGDDQPKLQAEFNDIKHVPGIVSMARTSDPNSATTQFFICVGTPSYLDHQYTAFGKVVSGLNIAEAISKMPRDAHDAPLKDEKVIKAYLVKAK